MSNDEITSTCNKITNFTFSHELPVKLCREKSNYTCDQQNIEFLPFIKAPFMLETVELISDVYSSFLTYSNNNLVFDRHCMTEFMKHVLPMFFKPFNPICLMLGADKYPRSSSPSLLSRSNELRSRRMLFEVMLFVDRLFEVPGCDSTFLLSLGEVVISWKRAKMHFLKTVTAMKSYRLDVIRKITVAIVIVAPDAVGEAQHESVNHE